ESVASKRDNGKRQFADSAVRESVGRCLRPNANHTKRTTNVGKVDRFLSEEQDKTAATLMPQAPPLARTVGYRRSDQCPAQIILQIRYVFDSDAEADQRVIDAAGLPHFRRDAGVRHGRGVA